MWTPTEVRKLIAQIAGFVFCGVGVWLLVSGVKASGSLDISSNVLSGKMESGSAGLFLIFLGFFLVLVPALFSGKHHHSYPVTSSVDNQSSTEEKEDYSPLKRHFIAALGLLALAVGSLFYGAHLHSLDMGIGAVFILAGIGAGLVGAVMLLGAILKWAFPDIEFS